MNRMIARLVGLALSLALMGALAACQQSEPAKDGPALSSAQAAVQAAPAKPAPAKAAPPRDPWEPGVVLVKFKPGVTAASADQIADSLGLRRGKPRRATGVDHMKITTGESVPAAAARVSKDPRVVYAEPNHRIALLNTPNDPRFTECWGLDNTGQTGGTAGADIGAVEAWDISIGSANVIVAVVDTGVDYTHPDLAPNIWVNEDEIAGNGIDDDNNGYVDDVRGYDFSYANDNDPMDEMGHGTHCAGTIGAYGNDGLGVAGVNWRVSIMPVRVIGNPEQPDLNDFCLDAAEGIRYAVDNGARVLSNSWWTVRQYNQTLHDTVMWTEGTGAILVFAAGNYGEDVDNPANNIYPASWHPSNMIGVAATVHTDELVTYENTEGWWASNFGATTIDVGAPGHNILSTVLGGAYELYSGTSMACPHVSGAVALMLSIRPDLDPAGVKAALFGSVDPLPSLQGVTTTGGRINLYRAMAVISGMPLPPVALAGGNHTVMTGTEVVLDGSRSFDPNQDPITYAWAFYPPAWSAASLDSLTIASPRFTADVCGLYQGVLTVTDDGGLVSQPDRGRIQAMNLNALDPVVESPHPYPAGINQDWVIQRPGAVVMAAHFSLFETYSGWEYVTILDGAGNEVARYSGALPPFDTATVTGDTMIVRLVSDPWGGGLQGFIVDQVWWCDAGACPAGQGDCNDDPADGCETDTSDDDLNCGWCDHSCAKPHAQFDCVNAICQFLACDPGWSDCDASLLNGCESDPLNDPLNCGGCGAPCEAMPHALPGCADGQCAIVECEFGWDDCNGVMADGCETDVTADPVNCGGCGVDCMALPGVESAYCDAAQCWLGNCTAEPDLVESPHPYSDGYDHTWTVQRAGATRMRVHFAYVDTEPCCDAVQVIDGLGTVVGEYRGYALPAFWSEWVVGDTLQIRLFTDYSVTADGFVVDQVMPCGEGACLDGFDDCDGLAETGCESEVADDPLNCGGCGLVCPTPDHAEAGCLASECQPGTCLAGWGDCNLDMADGCELDVTADEQNCGACGALCTPAHGTGECVASLCTLAACEAGYDNCDGDVPNGCEAELATDPLNCNGCGTACPAPAHAAPACLTGACGLGACDAGFADCDLDPATGCEIDTSTDAQNCATCGTQCAFAQAGASCVASACVMGACDAGFADCNVDPADGCEVDTRADAQNCSACGAVCAFPHAAAGCAGSACALGACEAGFGDCNQYPVDGCEAELAADAENCGACGTVCSFPHAAASCAANACLLGACEAGYDDCDADAASGCEATLATDAANCGECGHACEADESCQAGECVGCPDADQDGFTDAACGGEDCVDNNADVNPDADEVCDNLLDDDCDGATDADDADCGEDDDGGGCGCASSGSDTPAWLGLALALGLIASRRRARR